MKRKYIVLSLLLSLSLTPFNVTNSINASSTQEPTTTQTEEQVIAQTIIQPSLVAEAGIVMDGTTGQVLFAKNPDEQLSPASITKLMTALLAIETLNPEDTITFSDTALTSIRLDTSRIGMRENETITVNDALHGLLLMSANDVANGLAEATSGSIESFVYKMNQRATELGALNTHFTNPHGLYDPEHTTSVYDMALITKEIIKSDYFLSIMKDSLYQIPATNKANEIRYLSQQHKMLNTKKDLKIYRPDVIAGKVGFTTESGHTLVTVAQREDHILICVIMKTDANHLYSDTTQLLDYGFDQFESVTIEPSDFVQSVPIKDASGEIGTATVSIASSIKVLLPLKSDKSAIQYTPTLPDFFTTDIAKDQVKGSIALTYNSLPMGTYDLIITGIDGTITDTTKKEATKKEASTDVKSNKKLPVLKIIIILCIVIALGLFITYKYLELKVKRARLARKREQYLKIKQSQR